MAATLAAGLPLVKGNRVQLQQVLLNLIINGCEAMAAVAPKHRQLLVSTEMNDDAAALVCVTDGGPGIPPQDLDNVFDPFFSTKTNGLGAGLSVSRSIIASTVGVCGPQATPDEEPVSALRCPQCWLALR